MAGIERWAGAQATVLGHDWRSVAVLGHGWLYEGKACDVEYMGGVDDEVDMRERGQRQVDENTGGLMQPGGDDARRMMVCCCR